MSSDNSAKRRAFDHYNTGEYRLAGEQFTRSAYEILSQWNGESDRPLASGLYYFAFASLSFRRSGAEERAANRAHQGVLIATDASDHHFDNLTEKGVLMEYAGDLTTIGGRENAEEYYRKAAQLYWEDDTGYTTARNSNPLDSRLFELFDRLLRDTDWELEEWFEPRYNYASRVAFKSEEYEKIISSLVAQSD